MPCGVEKPSFFRRVFEPVHQSYLNLSIRDHFSPGCSTDEVVTHKWRRDTLLDSSAEQRIKQPLWNGFCLVASELNGVRRNLREKTMEQYMRACHLDSLVSTVLTDSQISREIPGSLWKPIQTLKQYAECVGPPMAGIHWRQDSF